MAIITSHPIQYNAPLFQLLAKRGRVEIKVFYTWGKKSIEEKFDPGFGKNIKWDIPLLDGYNYQFLENTSKNPGSHNFSGIKNPSIIEEIKSFSPNAILLFGWSFHSHLKVLRHFKGKVKILFRGDSTLLDQPAAVSIKKILRKTFLTWVYKHIDVALYVGECNRNYFLNYGLKENQLVFAPHFVDNNRFKNSIDSNLVLAFKSQFSIKQDDFVYVFVGKLEHKKRPLLLLNAFADLNLQNAHLIFVGNGEQESELRQHANQFSSIHFLPFQNQTIIPSVYATANYLVLPSGGPNETWGLVVNEAMACGIPAIVSTKVGCAADLIDNGKNGFVFKADDEFELKNALKTAYDSKHCYASFSKNASDTISFYTIENTAKVIEEKTL
ncbi:MAG: glycosyltransferase family 4 protein [Chitinophagaceae bacterium]